MRPLLAAALGAPAALAGCEAGPDQRLAILGEPRVLAIVAEPAEARPGEQVTYTAVVGSAAGPVGDARRWSYCLAPKPPTEDNAVSVACVGDAAELAPLGEAASVTATLPGDGCIRFGPDVPPGGFRPRGADPSGGYYQPVRVDVGDLYAFGMSRITCRLPAATFEVAREYDLNYVANQAPAGLALELPATVPADTVVELAASWPAGAAETYLYFDPLAHRLVTRREAMRVSWFATGGHLPVDATAVDEDDPATRAATTWRTPATPGPAHVWIVLRDSRGGIATLDAAITVE